jgi:hypothetical protein
MGSSSNQGPEESQGGSNSQKISPAKIKLEAGGKPSTWLPPGELVEHSSKNNPMMMIEDDDDDDDDDNDVSTWQTLRSHIS